MIYSAKIRRMSRRRQKIAVRRKLRKILRADLQPFIGQRVGRETMARMIRAMADSFRQLAAGITSVRAFFSTEGGHRLDALIFLPRPLPVLILRPRFIRIASPLKTELANLRRNYDRDEDKLAVAAAKFWRDGGVCCPSCGVRGYSELLMKQERRLKRMKEIRAHLQRHGGA